MPTWSDVIIKKVKMESPGCYVLFDAKNFVEIEDALFIMFIVQKKLVNVYKCIFLQNYY